jgi:hypothetical protein
MRARRRLAGVEHFSDRLRVAVRIVFLVLLCEMPRILSAVARAALVRRLVTGRSERGGGDSGLVVHSEDKPIIRAGKSPEALSLMW